MIISWTLALHPFLLLLCSANSGHEQPLTTIEEDQFSIGHPRSLNAIITRQWLKDFVEKDSLEVVKVEKV